MATHRNCYVPFDGLLLMRDGLACAIRGAYRTSHVYVHIGEHWSIVTMSRDLSDILGGDVVATRTIH